MFFIGEIMYSLQKIIFLGGIMITSGCSLFGIQTEEQPQYKVLKKDSNKEIRLYDSYLVIKTQTKGTYKDAQNKDFRILAGYIFGDNKTGEKISMTSPVRQYQTGDNWEMTFMIPKKYDLKDLPEPKSDNIEFKVLKKKTYGVITFSGSDNEEKNKRYAEELKSWILTNEKDFKIVSVPIYAGYNPPWTIPIFRKNEIMFELNKKDEDILLNK